jgi:hypothetical protein
VIPAHPPSRTACRWWGGFAILVVGVLLAQSEAKALRAIGNDFTAYLEAAGALAAGGNPYLVAPRFPYSYPLTLAWLFVPLRLLPIWLAAAAWFGASVFAFWRLVTGSAEAAAPRISRCESIALAVIVAIALLQIVQNELLNGQINLVVAALALAAAALSERGRPLPAAAVWGLGIALKLFPLVLAPWFLLRRRWTELVGGPVVAAILCLVPALWVGVDAVRWTLDYFRNIYGGEAGTMGVPDFIHLNLAWSIGRLAGFPSTPIPLTLSIGALLIAFAAWSDRRRGSGAPGARAAAAYLSLVVLLSPKSETHHMVFSIPAVTWLAVRGRTARSVLALAVLIVLFNIGFVVAAVRDPFLLIFALGVALWCMAE